MFINSIQENILVNTIIKDEGKEKERREEGREKNPKFTFLAMH